MAGKAGAKRGLAAGALKHFLDHPGEYVRVEDLAYELGEVTDQQAAAAVTYVIREGKLAGLKAIQRGAVWVYEPEDNDETKWSLVRVTANGAQAVLEDIEGNLWVAKPAGI
jgi:hypothetical protein